MSPSMPVTAIFAPIPAKPRAIAAPIPRYPPVMSATLPRIPKKRSASGGMLSILTVRAARLAWRATWPGCRPAALTRSERKRHDSNHEPDDTEDQSVAEEQPEIHARSNIFARHVFLDHHNAARLTDSTGQSLEKAGDH